MYTLPISAREYARNPLLSYVPAQKCDLRLESKMSERSDMPIVFPAPLPEESAKNGDPERRAQGRFPFTAAAEVCEIRSRTRVKGRCSDLSFGGCYVDTLIPFAVGAVVKVRVERDTREFEATAVVAYAHVSLGMGLAFTEVKREHQEVLRFWIAELSGEQSPEPAGSTTGPEPGAIEANADTRLVLNELITLLVRKKIITENEGSGLFREIFR